MSKSKFIRLILKSHGYYIDLFKVIRHKNNILVEAMPYILPGWQVEDGTLNKRIIAPLHKNIHWHLTYPKDGSVHQKLSYNDQNTGRSVEIYESSSSLIYSVYDENHKRTKMYNRNEWFEERVFFRNGGVKGSQLKDYKTNERRYTLYHFGFPIINGYTLISFDEKQENEIDLNNDLIVDITEFKNAVGNVFVYLHGKNYALSQKFKKENEKLHFQLDNSDMPTIEIGLTLRENAVFYS